MCDVCRSENEDWEFRNGKNSKLLSVKLYRVYQGREARSMMCYLHSIELFMAGERRFLRTHLRFARYLAQKSSEYEEDNGTDYGFGAF